MRSKVVMGGPKLVTAQQIRARAAATRTYGHGRRNLKFLGSLALFVLVSLVAPPALRGTLRYVAAFDVAGIALLSVLWTLGMHADARQTQRRAALDDPGRNVILAIVLGIGVIAFAAAVEVLGKQLMGAHGAMRYVTLVFGILAVIVGWGLIQTIFTFRYAHLYYYDADGDGRPSGIEFPGTENPNDFDFAYFSFVLGMTFQTSDTNITETRVRREALVHSIVSFAYSAGIIALGVNIASGLLH